MSVRFLKRKYLLTRSIGSGKMFLLNNIKASVSLSSENISIIKTYEIGLLEYVGDRMFVGFNYLTHNILIQESNISATIRFKTLTQLYGLTNYLLYTINLIENNLSINKSIENSAYYFEKFTQSVFLGLFEFDILSDIETQENNISINKVIDNELYLDGVVPQTVELGLEQKFNGLANLSSENVSIIKNVNSNLSLMGGLPQTVSIQLYNYSNNSISIQENNFSVAKDIVNEPSLLGTLVFELYIQTLLNLLTKDIMVQENNLSIKTNINNNTNILGVKTIFNDTQATNYFTHDINVQDENISIIKTINQRLEYDKDNTISFYLGNVSSKISNEVNTQSENIEVVKSFNQRLEFSKEYSITVYLDEFLNNITSEVKLQSDSVSIQKSFNQTLEYGKDNTTSIHLGTLQNELSSSINTQSENIFVSKNMSYQSQVATQIQKQVWLSTLNNITKNISIQENNVNISKTFNSTSSFTISLTRMLSLSLENKLSRVVNLSQNNLAINKNINNVVSNVIGEKQILSNLMGYIVGYNNNNSLQFNEPIHDRPIQLRTQMYFHLDLDVSYRDNNEQIIYFDYPDVGDWSRNKVLFDVSTPLTKSTDLKFTGALGTTQFTNINPNEILIEVDQQGINAYIGDMEVNYTNNVDLVLDIDWRTPIAMQTTSRPTIEKGINNGIVRVRFYNNDSSMAKITYWKTNGSKTSISRVLPNTWSSWVSMACSDGSCPTNVLAEAIAPGKKVSSTRTLALNTPQVEYGTWQYKGQSSFPSCSILDMAMIGTICQVGKPNKVIDGSKDGYSGCIELQCVKN